jgi:hypothetical protein
VSGTCRLKILMGRSLHCQVEYHVRTKFVTPILHAIYSFAIYDIFFYIYITIDSIFGIWFEMFSHHLFVVIVLIQFCVILVRNGMFWINKKSSNLVIHFYYVIDTMYIYSRKEIIKFWPILVMLYWKSRIFLFARGVQLDNGVASPRGFFSGRMEV